MGRQISKWKYNDGFLKKWIDVTREDRVEERKQVEKRVWVKILKYGCMNVTLS